MIHSQFTPPHYRELIVTLILTIFLPAACQLEPQTTLFSERTAVSASADYVTDTKAALLSSVPDSFSMFACSYSGSTPTGVDYIYNETMTKSDSKWISANKFRKVASDKTVKYFAVYPSNATGLTLPTADAAGTPVFGYTLPGNASNQSDIIVASHDYSGSQENITLAFSHILAAVDFKFSSDGSFDGTIKSVSIKNVNTKGSYTLGTGWSNLSTSGSVTQTLNKAVTESMGGTAITTSSNAITVIPQTAGGDAVLEVVANDGTKDVTMECSLSGEVFEVGKDYTIALDLSAMATSALIIQSIDVTAWVNDATKYTLSEVMEYADNIPSGTFQLPIMTLSQNLEMVIDWGDGTIEKVQMAGDMAPSHKYSSKADRTIKVYARNGTITFSAEVEDEENSPYTILNNTVCVADIHSVIFDLSYFDYNGELTSKQNSANTYVLNSYKNSKIREKGINVCLPCVYGNTITDSQSYTASYTPMGTVASFYNAYAKEISDMIIEQDVTNSSISGTIDSGTIVWTDTESLISNIKIVTRTLFNGKECKYLQFKVKGETGRAVVAAKVGEDIVWSWSIWVINRDLQLVDIGQKFLNEPLLWQPEGDNQGSICLYQWGRKDPMTPSRGTSFIPLSMGALGKFNNTYDQGPKDVAKTIKNPDKFISASNSCWYYVNYGPYPYNYWNNANTNGDQKTITDEIKTIYDPCPAGFCIPNYYYAKIIKEYPNQMVKNRGMKISSSLSLNYIFLPITSYLGTGYPSYEISSIYKSYTYFWSSTPSDKYKSYSLKSDCSSSSGSLSFSSEGQEYGMGIIPMKIP